jgi:hypothetical protein
MSRPYIYSEESLHNVLVTHGLQFSYYRSSSSSHFFSFLATVLAYRPFSKDISSQERYAKKNGKAIPLQARTGPEGSRSLRLPEFKKIGTRRW